MIVNWMCLFVYLKYKFTSTYLILLLSITTFSTVLNVLVASLCKPVIHKLNILRGGKLEHYQLINHKKRGRRMGKFEISVGRSERVKEDFWLKFVGGKTRRKQYKKSIRQLPDKDCEEPWQRHHAQYTHLL